MPKYRPGKFQGGAMGGKMDINQVMRQAQKMQSEMENVQEELGKNEVEASSGGGAVNVKVNGKKEVLSIKINPDVVDADDVEMLEDLVLAAVNEAMRKADEMMQEGMEKVTGGMNIPGLF